MERKINSTFKYQGKTYIVKEHEYCDKCDFHCSFCHGIFSFRGPCSAWDRKDKKSVVFVELPKEEETMENVEISKENILKAAKENPCAEKVLKDLFPKVFGEEENKPFCKIGSIFKVKYLPKNIYTVFKHGGFVRILNITDNKMELPNRNLRISDLKDPEKQTLTVSEFKRMINYESLEDFNFNVEVIEK